MAVLFKHTPQDQIKSEKWAHHPKIHVGNGHVRLNSFFF